MAEVGNLKLDASKLVTLNIQVTLPKTFKLRVWLAVRLITVATWIFPVDTNVVTTKK